jgi:predicted secreted protein
MSATAAHPAKVYVRSDATTPGSGDEIAYVNNVDFSPNIAMLDITDFKDTSAAKKKLAGLTDGSISMSGPLDLADTIQNLLRSSLLSGADVYVQVHFNPSGSSNQKGYSVVCKVKSCKLSGQVDGLNEFSAELEFNGAPATV